MQTRDIKRIELNARLWQDYYGNTYHNCDIYINDIKVHEINFAYGYGSHYGTTSLKWLMKNIFSKQLNKKINNDKYFSLWRLCDEVINCKFISKSYYVDRKKDM